MLIATHSAYAPWTIVHTDKKKKARLAVISHLLHALAPAQIVEHVPKPDPKVISAFDAEAITDGRLET
jgi:hypothetical protein